MAPYRISSPGMAKRVLIKTRSIISSAQSPYNVCTVLRQPEKSPRRNSAWKLAGSLSVLGVVGCQNDFALFY